MMIDGGVKEVDEDKWPEMELNRDSFAGGIRLRNELRLSQESTITSYDGRLSPSARRTPRHV